MCSAMSAPQRSRAGWSPTPGAAEGADRILNSGRSVGRSSYRGYREIAIKIKKHQGFL